jgi:hypothetical protein
MYKVVFFTLPCGLVLTDHTPMNMGIANWRISLKLSANETIGRTGLSQ